MATILTVLDHGGNRRVVSFDQLNPASMRPYEFEA